MNQDENMKDSRYEEALERARAGKPIDEVFPELKESEDERIRKEIINYILYKADGVSEEQEHSWIAYLEKQKDLTKDIMLGYPAHYFYDGEKMHFCGNPAMEKKQKEQNPLSTEETELNSIAFLEQMGYTCIPPGKELKHYTYEQSKQAAEDCYYDKGYNTEDDGRCNEQSFLWGFEEGVDWCEQQKEQKPAEYPEKGNKMKTPDKIFLPGDIDWPSAAILTLGNQPGDIEFIRKDALLEWLQKEYDTNKWFYDTHAKPNNLHIGRCEAYKKVIDKIESL